MARATRHDTHTIIVAQEVKTTHAAEHLLGTSQKSFRATVEVNFTVGLPTVERIAAFLIKFKSK
jgi:hypothetical protein